MALITIVVGVITVGFIGYCIAAIVNVSRRPTESERAAQQFRQARYQVDEVFHEARVQMEEAAGRRRSGERRVQDGLRGSWRNW